MGIDTASAMWLCAARSLGADFSRTATIGRQSFTPDARVLGQIFRVLGIDEDAKRFLFDHAYAEAFLSALGATETDSVDYSSFEDATIIHDLNLPLPNELHERF